MKIAIVINTSWNIYNFRRGLVTYFLDQGDDVLAIAPEDDYSEKLKEIGCSYRKLEMSASGMNPIADLGLIAQFYKILREERPDVLLTYTIKPNIYGSFVSGVFGIPCICNVSGLGTVFLWKGYVKKIATSLYSLAFRFNKWVFFQNDEDRTEFQRFVSVDITKTSLLPGSGIDVERFKPGKRLKNTNTVFLMIARLLVEKGIYDFIDAIKELRKKEVKAEFRLVGGLDETHSRAITREELNGWIEEGLISHIEHLEDVRVAIAGADVVVLPSYREGTPRTLLEAGAMGKPLIATNVAGCKHVVMDGYNGFLCKLRSPTDLASKMKLFMALSIEEKQEMSSNARKSIVERFDQQLVIDQYARIIDEQCMNTPD